MADPSILNAAVTVAFGALAGGITNAVAIWMLFHPYDSKGVGGMRIQGAIPKNKTRLAKTIGRTVGQRLLTPADLTANLSSPGVRNAFDEAVRGFVGSLLDVRRGSLREELPDGLSSELEQILGDLVPRAADKASEYARTPEFKRAVRDFIAQVSTDLSDRPLGEVLTEARRNAISERVESWVVQAVNSEDVDAAIGSWLDRQLFRLANDNTPMLERMPEQLVAAVEKSVAGYLPMAMDRLQGALSNKETRKRLQEGLHGLFRKFVEDLLLHERIVAKLVVTEKTISRLLDNFEKTGADQIAELLNQPEMRDEISHSVNQAMVNFLRKPISEHLSALGPEKLEGVKETAREHIVAALRDEGTRALAIERLDKSLQSFEKRTWGELLAHVPPDDAADLLSEAASTPKVREWIEEALQGALTSLLDRQIGRPVDWLGDDAVEQVSQRLSPVLWKWIEEQIPPIVERIDVAGMVEEKVLGFSLERIEELVRATTQRELNLIIRLGYVLGAVVGAVAYTVSLILP